MCRGGEALSSGSLALAGWPAVSEQLQISPAVMGREEPQDVPRFFPDALVSSVRRGVLLQFRTGKADALASPTFVNDERSRCCVGELVLSCSPCGWH